MNRDAGIISALAVAAAEYNPVIVFRLNRRREFVGPGPRHTICLDSEVVGLVGRKKGIRCPIPVDGSSPPLGLLWIGSQHSNINTWFTSALLCGIHSWGDAQVVVSYDNVLTMTCGWVGIGYIDVNIPGWVEVKSSREWYSPISEPSDRLLSSDLRPTRPILD